jgi:hypothetical protein
MQRPRDGYTRAILGNGFGKHIPVARQQILNNVIVGLQQWKIFVFYVVHAEVISETRFVI